MSVATRTETGRRPARRVHDAERVKSGAAQRAYARRRQRAAVPPTAAAPAGSELTGRVPFVTAILAMFGCGLALTLVLTTRAAEDSYQLSDAREANRVLSDERAALEREVAAADSAPELATRARELGMIPAVDPARLVVGPDGTITVIGEPAPAQGAPAPPLNPPPRNAPHNGGDPGERVVPVPELPHAGAPAATVPGAVLAAPGTGPASVTPESVPTPGGPAGALPDGTPPAGDPAAAPAPQAAVPGEQIPPAAAPAPGPEAGVADGDNPGGAVVPTPTPEPAPPVQDPAAPAGEGMR
ncbi:FtsB family cell division protein [Nocardia sp. NPDC003345]